RGAGRRNAGQGLWRAAARRHAQGLRARVLHWHLAERLKAGARRGEIRSALELWRAAREGSRAHPHGYHAGMEDRTSQLKNIARRLMREHGLEPGLSTAALEQLRTIGAAPLARGPGIRDLRHLPWCSIDLAH